MRLADRPLMIVDVETTGLDPDTNAIIEIAAITLDPKTMAETGRFQSLIKPHEGAVITPQAMAVNKIKSSDLELAPDLKTVMEKFCAFAKGCVHVGQNPAFDMAFLKAASKRTGTDYARVLGNFHMVDVASLAWPLLVAGKIPSIGAAKIAAHFGIEKGIHRALSDCEATAECFKRLLAA